jgi:hypothetical protein
MWHDGPAETTGMVEAGAEPMRRMAVIDRTQRDRWRWLLARFRERGSGCGIPRQKLAEWYARH